MRISAAAVNGEIKTLDALSAISNLQQLQKHAGKQTRPHTHTRTRAQSNNEELQVGVIPISLRWLPLPHHTSHTDALLLRCTATLLGCPPPNPPTCLRPEKQHTPTQSSSLTNTAKYKGAILGAGAARKLWLSSHPPKNTHTYTLTHKPLLIYLFI